MSGCDVCAVVVEAASLCVWVHMGANSLRGAWIVCAPNLWSAARVSPVRCLLMPVSCMSSLRTNHHIDGAEQLASLQVRAWVCGTVIGMMAAWISGDRLSVRSLEPRRGGEWQRTTFLQSAARVCSDTVWSTVTLHSA